MKLRILTCAVACSTLLSAWADEGMWLLPTLKQQNTKQLKKLGLKLEVDDLYNPDGRSIKDAVVIFGGGCTGEVISSEGLVLTNHHCGYGAIQKLSSVEHDYLTDGYWAMDRSKELPAKGLTITFIDKIEEVTDFVQKALIADPTKGELAFLSPTYLAKVCKSYVGEDFSAKKTNSKVEIKPYYNGNQYYAIYSTVYTDIRLVGAPPSSIGKFGFDTDNWVWPRHTGDFSLFRIYADKDGKPAEYSPNNVPLRPKNYLKISLKGFNKGDFAFIMGFPGRTNRYMTSWEIESMKDIENTLRVDIRGTRQDEMFKKMRADQAVNIQYANKFAGSSNYWKNSMGMNEAIRKLDVIGLKKQQEQEYTAWAASKDYAQYIQALVDIQKSVTESRTVKYQLIALAEALLRGIECASVESGYSFIKTVYEEKRKTLNQSELDEVEKAFNRFYDKDYNPIVDKDVAKAMLRKYASLIPAKDRPSFFQIIEKKYKGNSDRYVDDLFAKSIFVSKTNFEKFKSKPKLSVLENDPVAQFANSVSSKFAELTAHSKTNSNTINLARKVYTEGLLLMRKGSPIYPDANFTIRLTYGSIEPYSPRDGVTYDFVTTLDGVMEKEDPNNFEFEVPSKLKELHLTKDFGRYALANGKMPVAFLTNNDITGGNSGSPVINANGELIGTAFDGNWEALSGDLVFENNLQRCINVDIRYTLFIIEKYGNAKHIVDEMDIVE